MIPDKSLESTKQSWKTGSFEIHDEKIKYCRT